VSSNGLTQTDPLQTTMLNSVQYLQEMKLFLCTQNRRSLKMGMSASSCTCGLLSVINSDHCSKLCISFHVTAWTRQTDRLPMPLQHANYSGDAALYLMSTTASKSQKFWRSVIASWDASRKSTGRSMDPGQNVRRIRSSASLQSANRYLVLRE